MLPGQNVSEALPGRLRLALLAPALALLALLAAADGLAQERQWQDLDRVVATVEGSPVLLSDILMEKDLRLLEGPSESSAADDLLEPYINRLLILLEVREVGSFGLASGLEESAYTGYVQGFGSEGEYERKLARWGIDEAEVNRRLVQALLASLYTESRIQFFVRVLPGDIEQAYNDDPDRWGGLDLYGAWDMIRERLQEQAFEREKSRWLQSLRERYRLRFLERQAGGG